MPRLFLLALICFSAAACSPSAPDYSYTADPAWDAFIQRGGTLETTTDVALPFFNFMFDEWRVTQAGRETSLRELFAATAIMENDNGQRRPVAAGDVKTAIDDFLKNVETGTYPTRGKTAMPARVKLRRDAEGGAYFTVEWELGGVLFGKAVSFGYQREDEFLFQRAGGTGTPPWQIRLNAMNIMNESAGRGRRALYGFFPNK